MAQTLCMATTETEIFDRMMTSFREAAECCDRLASQPKTGPTYKALREHLELIAGSARQAAHWRMDARFLALDAQMTAVHDKAGTWLRGHYARQNFTVLANVLRKLHRDTQRIRTARVGRMGAILPTPQAVHRETRPVPVGWRKTGSGILLPEGRAA